MNSPEGASPSGHMVSGQGLFPSFVSLVRQCGGDDPGSPASACTLLDGYPMAQQGKAKKALKTAMYSSVVADVISNVALIFFAAYLAKIALNFGPPEYFWLICFSLTIIVSVSGISVVKGLIAAFLGIIVSTIGLFAIPEVIDFYTSRVAPHIRTAVTGASLTWKEFKASLKTIIRGSIIGVIIGAIPGTGATSAAFISYSEAKRTSPRKDNFGKGEVEGVAAAEAGNNGVAGATLIPLLSLGIPGDVIAAIILGAFMIHGLTPGPVLFQENLTLVYALFCGILVSSAVLLVVGNAAIKYFSLIADIPKTILLPLRFSSVLSLAPCLRITCAGPS